MKIYLQKNIFHISMLKPKLFSIEKYVKILLNQSIYHHVKVVYIFWWMDNQRYDGMISVMDNYVISVIK